jgi:hypothetical protein
MYWCNASRYSITGLFVLLLTASFWSCRPEVKQSNGTLKYFDLSGYFKAEAARLAKQHKPIVKTVSYNGKPETKNILIKNWVRELDLFTSSDINKAAWKDSYQIAKSDDSIVYTTIDTNLHSRRIVISLKTSQVKAIIINNFTKNMLYETSEKLIYYPDSLYYIEKHQHVKLLGTNTYQIIGRFK